MLLEATAGLPDALFSLARHPLAQAAGTWIIAIVLTWSGVAKLRNPGRAAAALVRFGALNTPHRSAGIALGVTELALAGAAATAGFVGLVACAIAFAFFSLILIRALAHGDRSPCFCFGSEEPMAWPTAGRALLLAVTAGTIAVTTQDSVTATHSALGLVLAASLLGSVLLATALPTVLRVSKTGAAG